MKSYISRKLPAATRITCLILALRSWAVILLLDHQYDERSRFVHATLGIRRPRRCRRHAFHGRQKDTSARGIVGHRLSAALRGDCVDDRKLVGRVLANHGDLA